MSLSSALSGAALGAALTYASVSDPRIILEQFAFKDMHMIRVFMTATAGSAILTTVLSRFRLFTPFVRPPITLGFWSRYDGNILGGLLIGTGMAFTGACPGSVIPQLAAGVPTALPAFLGAITGGLLWVWKGEQLHRPSPAPTKSNTFHERLGLSQSTMLALYISACLSVVYLSRKLDQTSSILPGLTGGLGIIAAQAISMLLTKNALCSSGSFEETAQWIIWSFQRAIGRIDSTHAKPRPPPCSNTGSMFAVGEFFGAALLAKALDLPYSATTASQITSDLQLAKLFVGGVALGFGARLAGGCTSGHGISGMSAFSIASLVTVCAMFGGGIAVAAVLN